MNGTDKLTEDFNGTFNILKWFAWTGSDPDAQAGFQNGKAFVNHDGKQHIYAGIDSIGTFKLTACHAYIQIVQPLGDPNAETFFGVGPPLDLANTGVGFIDYGTALAAAHHENNMPDDDLMVTPASWVKLVDDGVGIHWLTSNDGVTWAEVRMMSPKPAWLMTPIKFHFGAGSWPGFAVPAIALFDHLNTTQ